MGLFYLISLIIELALVMYVSVHSYHKHSLSYGGAWTAGIVGSIHVLAGWRHAVLLIFFFITRYSSFLSVTHSSKLTKMWSSVKKQKEEGFVFGGERNFYQVFSNSFIPTIICIYIAFAKMGIVPYLSERIGYQESRVLLCQFIHRYAIASYGFGVLLRMFSRYLGK